MIKKYLAILLVLGGIQVATSQEQLSRAEALKVAFAVSLDLPQLQGTPIPTDVDLKRPIALRDGDYGGLFLPEAKLTAQAIANAGEQPQAVGQLWLHKLTPMRDGQPIYSDRLRMARVDFDGDTVRVPQCTVGVRRNGGKLELVLLGKTTEPLVVATLKEINGSASEPFRFEAERDYSGGTATLTLFGKYRAEMVFTELEY